MNIQYLFSSPDGDITLTGKDLARPFLITPTEPHPFLTLGDYFQSIEAFILKDSENHLEHILGNAAGTADIQEILIRSEKHGALYHPASIDIHTGKQRHKLTVSTAVTEKGKAWLAHEYDILKRLNNTYRLPYLPEVYLHGEVACKRTEGMHETLAMLLAEWFEGYHEWHFSIDKKDKTKKIAIWDMKNGHRYASKTEAFEILKQASKVLTLYYDTKSFNQIYPWHHAAGDFIVGTLDGKIDVKLTTARQYASIMDFFSDENVNPAVAIVYFFLNLTVRMGLDKLDGVGKTIWVGNSSTDAATAGFFEALILMETEGRYDLGKVEDLLSLLQSFSEQELGGLFQSLLALYEEDDPEDLAKIEENLGTQINLLYRTLRNFRLSSLQPAF